MSELKKDPRLARIKADVIQRIRDEGFMSCTFSGRKRGTKPDFQRVHIRPVVLRGERIWQAVSWDTEQSYTRSIDDKSLNSELSRILDAGYSEIHLMSGDGDMHVKFSKKGRMMISRSKPMQRDVNSALPHDRVKKRPLDNAGADSFLRVAGILDDNGHIKPSMNGKFRQVNEFLRFLDFLPGEDSKALTIVDCGCGRAILLFAAYYYIRNVLKRDLRIIGIDSNPKVIATCRKWASTLDLDDVATFYEMAISDFRPEDAPDIVMSLHACDTATDEALAGAVRWNAQAVLCAPCCQHDLQKKIKNTGALRGMLRHGILRERFADLLTDTFRSQLLRITGYRVRVMEFVDSDATARNIMLRAEKGVRRGSGDAVAEYLELCDYWKVTPVMASLLGDGLTSLLGKYDD